MERRVRIRTENLTHRYKTGVTALKGVNTEIFSDDIVSIVGQNGSGKTTLVRHFNGLLRPTSGNVILDDEDTKNLSIGKMSRKVGYVFQNPNHQIFSTTVREELEVAPKNFGMSVDEMNEAIARVAKLMDIEGDLNKHPLTLDYTTKKIVTIASVLVFNPEVLVLDEPTGGLDQAGRLILNEIIEMMHKQGHAVVIISHDMDYVAENSRRMIVMSDGCIIADGKPQEIFLQEDILKQAQIEPPQIAQLDMGILGKKSSVSLSVDEFVQKYKHHIKS